MHSINQHSSVLVFNFIEEMEQRISLKDNLFSQKTTILITLNILSSYLDWHPIPKVQNKLKFGLCGASQAVPVVCTTSKVSISTRYVQKSMHKVTSLIWKIYCYIQCCSWIFLLMFIKLFYSFIHAGGTRNACTVWNVTFHFFRTLKYTFI